MSPLSGAIVLSEYGPPPMPPWRIEYSSVNSIGIDVALFGPGGAAGIGVAGEGFVAFRDQGQVVRAELSSLHM